jgi:hypothetical protein
MRAFADVNRLDGMMGHYGLADPLHAARVNATQARPSLAKKSHSRTV